MSSNQRRSSHNWRSVLLSLSGIASVPASDGSSSAEIKCKAAAPITIRTVLSVSKEKQMGKQVTDGQRKFKAYQPEKGTAGPLRAEFTGDKTVAGGDPGQAGVRRWKDQAERGRRLNDKAVPGQQAILNQRSSTWRALGSSLLNDGGGRAETLQKHELDGQGAAAEYKTGGQRTWQQRTANIYLRCPSCGHEGDADVFGNGADFARSRELMKVCPQCGHEFRFEEGDAMGTGKHTGVQPSGVHEQSQRTTRPDVDRDSLHLRSEDDIPPRFRQEGSHRRSAWHTGAQFVSRQSGRPVVLQTVGPWSRIRTSEIARGAQMAIPRTSAEGTQIRVSSLKDGEREFGDNLVVVAYTRTDAQGTQTTVVCPLSEFVRSFRSAEACSDTQVKPQGMKNNTKKKKKKTGTIERGWRAFKALAFGRDDDVCPECGSTSTEIMPPDFETHGCKTCGYQWTTPESTVDRGELSHEELLRHLDAQRPPHTAAEAAFEGAAPPFGSPEREEWEAGGRKSKKDDSDVDDDDEESEGTAEEAEEEETEKKEAARGPRWPYDTPDMREELRRQRQAGVEFTKKPDGQINISVEADPVNGMGTADTVNGQPMPTAPSAQPAAPAAEAPDTQGPSDVPGAGAQPGQVKPEAAAKKGASSLITVGQMLVVGQTVVDPQLGTGQVESIVGDQVLAVFSGHRYQTTLSALGARVA